MRKIILLTLFSITSLNFCGIYTASKTARKQCKDLKILAVEAKLALEGYRSSSPTSPRGTDWALLRRLMLDYKNSRNAYMSCLMITDGVEEFKDENNETSYRFVRGAYGPQLGAEIW